MQIICDFFFFEFSRHNLFYKSPHFSSFFFLLTACCIIGTTAAAETWARNAQRLFALLLLHHNQTHLTTTLGRGWQPGKTTELRLIKTPTVHIVALALRTAVVFLAKLVVNEVDDHRLQLFKNHKLDGKMRENGTKSQERWSYDKAQQFFFF